jgi:hypothetical protein
MCITTKLVNKIKKLLFCLYQKKIQSKNDRCIQVTETLVLNQINKSHFGIP